MRPAGFVPPTSNLFSLKLLHRGKSPACLPSLTAALPLPLQLLSSLCSGARSPLPPRRRKTTSPSSPGGGASWFHASRRHIYSPCNSHIAGSHLPAFPHCCITSAPSAALLGSSLSLPPLPPLLPQDYISQWPQRRGSWFRAFRRHIYSPASRDACGRRLVHGRARLHLEEAGLGHPSFA